MDVNLYCKAGGEGSSVILLHGLFGMGGNLGPLARSLQDRYRTYSLDLPNHGRSSWSGEVGIGAMAAAVHEWMNDQGLVTASLVGHSLGGKVAMRLALDYPERIDALVVADIAPVEYSPRHDGVFAALNAVVDKDCRSRSEAAEVMAGFLPEDSVRQFLLLSLHRDDEGRYRWRFNLEALYRHYAAVLEGLTSDRPYPGPVLFIKGSESDYIKPEHEDAVIRLFPAATLKVMAGCGHWLHAEQPVIFNGLVGRFLDRAAAGQAAVSAGDNQGAWENAGDSGAS